jgi:hypothetical protein
MLVDFSQYRVGDPQRKGALTVFPLFSATAEGVDYLLAGEALVDRSVVVEEVSELGSVPDLVVENKSDSRVLFLEGEELVGAKQNRVLNTSVLISARSRTKIPVSCVEQGRWRYRNRNLETSGSFSTTRIRLAVKASVARSLRARRGHRSDQSTVWKEVDELETTHGVASQTHALSDVYEAHRDRIAELQEGLPYVDGAVGMAVAVGGKVVALDLFDKPSTCRKVWRGVLSGYVFDALETQAGRPAAGEVERLLRAAREAAWDAVETVGEGEEYRAELGADYASALCSGGYLVHGSISAAA